MCTPITGSPRHFTREGFKGEQKYIGLLKTMTFVAWRCKDSDWLSLALEQSKGFKPLTTWQRKSPIGGGCKEGKELTII